MLPEFGRDLVVEVIAWIEHRAQKALDLQFRVEGRLADLVDDVAQCREPLERKVLTLYRDHDGIRSHQGIDGQQVQGRRTVDQYIVVLAAHVCQRFAQTQLPPLEVDQLHLGTRELLVRRHHVIAGVDRYTCCLDGHVVDQHFIAARRKLLLVDAAAHGGITLRVHIDQHYAPTRFHQRRREIDARRGLAYASLLIRNSDCPTHVMLCAALDMNQMAISTYAWHSQRLDLHQLIPHRKRR